MHGEFEAVNGPRGVLWDMDGVLVDSGDLHFEAWAQTLAERGIALTREAFDATFGLNNTATLALILGGEPTPELVADIGDRKERLFREAIRGRVTPLPGVRLWLDRLGEAGVKQAVASSAPQANIDALIDELGIRPHFAALVAGHDLPAKPDPAVYVEAARQIGVPPRRCVVVEDSPHGVEGARRAGMACLAVTTTRPADSLRAASLIVDRLDALPEDAFERLFAAAKR